MPMNYFAYGSNMSVQRLQKRVPSAKLISRGTLTKHALRFHKAGSDGSSKCDAYYTNDAGDILWGVLFSISVDEKPALDNAEGLGFGYDTKQVDVQIEDGSLHSALTYFATKFDDTLLPYDWYLNHVLVGAREARLPTPYIKKIETINCKTDANISRSKKEFAIHTT